MLERVERLTRRVDGLKAVLAERFGKLGRNGLHAFEQARLAVGLGVRNSALEVVHHGKQIAHELFSCANTHLASLFGGALAIVVPFRLKAKVLIAHSGRFGFGLGDALGVGHDFLSLFLDGISLRIDLGGFRSLGSFSLEGRSGRFSRPFGYFICAVDRNLTRLLGGFVLTVLAHDYFPSFLSSTTS